MTEVTTRSELTTTIVLDLGDRKSSLCVLDRVGELGQGLHVASTGEA